jgi:peptide deformylase
MKTIVQDPASVLRDIAAPVAVEEFNTPLLKKIITNMTHALACEEDGVAIAAPQIGVSKQIFVISKKIFSDAETDIVCINPSFVRLGKKKIQVSEGCLSVRWKYGMVQRAETATIRAHSIEGNEFVLQGRGLLAQIFQHEIDHLNGVLFIDKAIKIENVPAPIKNSTKK